MTPASPLPGGDLALLGIRTRLESDDPALRAAALEAYAPWRSIALPPGAPRVRLRLSLGPGAAGGGERIEVEGPRLRLAGPDVVGDADARTGEARCRVDPSLAADPDRLVDPLDTLLLFLLTRAGRVPLHAAGFLLDESAVLLAGPGGVGKSTLAREALRAGFPVLSDDTVYLETGAAPRVWGFPRGIHLAPEGEGDGAGALRLRGGRWKERIDHPPAERPWAERAVLCLLAPGERVEMAPMDAEEAISGLGRTLEPGFDDFRDALPAAVRAVVNGGCWRLTLSRDPAAAIAAIRAALAG